VEEEEVEVWAGRGVKAWEVAILGVEVEVEGRAKREAAGDERVGERSPEGGSCFGVEVEEEEEEAGRGGLGEEEEKVVGVAVVGVVVGREDERDG
jgi:hypothetical protein